MSRHAVRDPSTGRFVKPDELNQTAAPTALESPPAVDVRADQPAPSPGRPPGSEAEGAGLARTPESTTATSGVAGARPGPMDSRLGSLLPRVVAESPVKPDPTPAPAAEPSPGRRPAPAPEPPGASPAPAGGRWVRVALGGAVGLLLLAGARLASSALRAWSGQRGQPQAAPTVAEDPSYSPDELAELRRMGIDPRTRTL